MSSSLKHAMAHRFTWRYLLETASRQLTKRPYWNEPRESAAFRRLHAQEYERFAAEAAAHDLVPNANMDYTGASATDYLFLRRYILKKRPSMILELGGGLTTYVMANALDEIGAGHIVSVDHIAAYSEGTRDLLSPQLRNRVTFHVSPMIGEVYGGVSALRYRDVPAGEYDLIYVDGPSAIFGKEQFPTLDALMHLRRSPGIGTAILIDRRLATVNYYSLWLTTDVQYDPGLHVGFIANARSGDLRRNLNSWRTPKVKIAGLLTTLTA